MSSSISGSRLRGLALSVLITVLLAYIAREVLYAGARSHERGLYQKLNTIFLQSNSYDMIFLGSSRAESHFDPEVIDSITGLQSYNAGLEGASMAFVHTAFKAYLHKSEAPRFAVLNVDLHSPGINYDTVHHFPRYFPYLSNPELYKGLASRDKRFALFRWIPFYSMPYYSAKYLNASLRGLAGAGGPLDTGWVQGFVPLGPAQTVPLDTFAYGSYSVSLPPVFFESLDSIAALCKRKSISLVMVLSPVYHRQVHALENRLQLTRKLREYAAKEGIPLIDHFETPVSYRPGLFADPDHLNSMGSRIFSRIAGAELRQYISR